jgi:hypothetical protein
MLFHDFSRLPHIQNKNQSAGHKQMALKRFSLSLPCAACQDLNISTACPKVPHAVFANP